MRGRLNSTILPRSFPCHSCLYFSKSSSVFLRLLRVAIVESPVFPQRQRAARRLVKLRRRRQPRTIPVCQIPQVIHHLRVLKGLLPDLVNQVVIGPFLPESREQNEQ